MLIELAVALGEDDRVGEWRADLDAIELTGPELRRVEGELRNASDLRQWLRGEAGEPDGD